VEYRQNVFLPQMAEYERQLVKFAVRDVERQEELNLLPGEAPIVLVAHDEMTAQANDGQKVSWLLDGEQPLKKKGVGRGLHQSDIVCSTVGWLKEASVTLEYSKNYDGYWTGELFVKQVCTQFCFKMPNYIFIQSQLKDKIIPAFERAHLPG